jgi:glycosyltransferase involved in cell wall biosynthesis
MSDSAAPVPLVSIIVVCHNDGRWLSPCLESIRAQTIFQQTELIIADNTSTDDTPQKAKSLIANWPNATWFSTGGDNGFGVACNRATDIARGKYIYLLNPDLKLEPECVERLLETAEREQAAATGGLVLEYDNNEVQVENCEGFDVFGNGMPPRGNRHADPVFSIACFYFLRKDTFVRVGRHDERFFMYGEEMDLSWRLLIAGEKLAFASGAKLHHKGAVGVYPPDGGGAIPAEPAGSGATAGNRTSKSKRFLANRNRLLGIAKNCQHILLLMFIPCSLLVLLEGVLTLAMTRDLRLARSTSLDAIVNCFTLRSHIRTERGRIAAIRRHGDFWMLRFFRFGFGRMYEVRQILNGGFPRFN